VIIFIDNLQVKNYRRCMSRDQRFTVPTASLFNNTWNTFAFTSRCRTSQSMSYWLLVCVRYLIFRTIHQ